MWHCLCFLNARFRSSMPNDRIHHSSNSDPAYRGPCWVCSSNVSIGIVAVVDFSFKGRSISTAHDQQQDVCACNWSFSCVLFDHVPMYSFYHHLILVLAFCASEQGPYEETTFVSDKSQVALLSALSNEQLVQLAYVRTTFYHNN